MYAQEGIHCDTCTNAAELMEMTSNFEVKFVKLKLGKTIKLFCGSEGVFVNISVEVRR